VQGGFGCKLGCGGDDGFLERFVKQGRALAGRNIKKILEPWACDGRQGAVRWCVAMPDTPIYTLGIILKKLGPILYRTELPNGKCVMGHLSKPLTLAAAEFPEGARVQLEMTPFDFDQARILGLFADAESAENDA